MVIFGELTGVIDRTQIKLSYVCVCSRGRSVYKSGCWKDRHLRTWVHISLLMLLVFLKQLTFK